MPGIVNHQQDSFDALLKKPSILNRKIDFVPAAQNMKSHPESLKFKYQHPSKAQSALTLSLKWTKSYPIGPGLMNMGNTCFLNSVLQCLVYTAPLAQSLLMKSHECASKTSCVLYALQEHIGKCFSGSSERTICPKSILSKLKLIAKQFKLGRQEDAHEFMLYMVESLQKSCMGKNIKKNTGLIHDIFGGSIQSQVVCQVCKTESNTVDPIVDLSLEIKNCDTLEKAVAYFTKHETLSGQNRYRCQK